MAANMYRVGDHVYFETSASGPYQIRRIEELNKTANGNVEAKVMCYFRRREIAANLVSLADKHQSALEEESEERGKEELNDSEKHMVKHRELFLSRQIDTLPATHIRGKCSVTLLNETESLQSYLNRDDAFFYALVYDPNQKTLLADKGEIRVGIKYQVAEIPPMLGEREPDPREKEILEYLEWRPDVLSGEQVDQFTVVARSVGTFARALDCTSTVRQPSLHMSAAAASRDVTLLHAMKVLHETEYDVGCALAALVPSGGPVLCRDEMEEWAASEANLFEEAMEKYGKDFHDIRHDFLPWKTLNSLVEYYYMWKTTDRFVQQKRIKATESESKLKQVYIPTYNKPNPLLINNSNDSKACESCSTTNGKQWYAWGPSTNNLRLCDLCWVYWKKYGGLKTPSRTVDERTVSANTRVSERIIAQPPCTPVMKSHRCTYSNCNKEFKMKPQLNKHMEKAHGVAMRPTSPNLKPSMKPRTAFCLHTTGLTRLSRRLCADKLNLSRAARNPFQPINITVIKQVCQQRLSQAPLRPLPRKASQPSETILQRLGIDTTQTPAILNRQNLKPPVTHLAFPKPDKMPLPRLRAASPNMNNSIKRPHENGIDSIVDPKRNSVNSVIRHPGGIRTGSPHHRNTVINQINGRSHSNTQTSKFLPKATSILKRGVLMWVDSQDDVLFIATDSTKKIRRQLTAAQLKRAGRKPWRRLPGVRTPLSITEQRASAGPTAAPLVKQDVVVVE